MTKFYLSSRDNTTLLLTGAGLERTFEKFTAIKRWNDVGSWVLNLRAEDTHTALFLPDGSGNLHAGIIFQVDNEDGSGLQTIMTGPTTDVDVAYNEDNTHVVQVSGACDNYWLKHRISLPFAGWPYESDVILGHGFAPVRYYTFGESAGPTATDLSTAAQNGTYTGGFTYSQPALIADPPTCVLPNGTTGFISVPTGGGTPLPVGNTAWSQAVWGMLSANPAGNVVSMSFGANPAANKQTIAYYVDTNGKPNLFVQGFGTATGATAVPLNIPFMMLMTYDGTTIKGFLNGTQFGSMAPSPLNIAYGNCNFGQFVNATQFWPGQLGHGTFFAQDMSARVDVRSLYPWPIWAYRVGQSELAFVDYATGSTSGTHADQDLDNFVSANLQFPAARAIFGGSFPAPGLSATCSQTYSRFDNLLTLAQYLALKSTPQLSFRMQQSGSNLVFSVTTSRDQSKTAVFSLARNNIRSYKWHYGAAKTNYLYAGGKQTITGVPESRIFAENSDATSISQFGRLEDFLDSRSAPDQATLQGAITAALAANKAQRSFQVTTKETAALYFMGPTANGYDVGDTVTSVLEGQTFVDVIREVSIDLQPNALPVVTPAIGTPTAAQVSSPVVTSTTNQLQANKDNISSQAINY